MNYRIIVWSITSALAGFLFGFDTVVISGAEQTIQSLWDLSPVMHGLAMGSALYGTVLGSLLGGWPTDRLRPQDHAPVHRRCCISYRRSAADWPPGSACSSPPASWAGWASASRRSSAPLYISEIAPPAYRGRLAGMFQFNIVFGIVIAFLSNAVIARIGGEDAWRWMLGIAAVPSARLRRDFALACLKVRGG